jgi:hypothetical protein
MVPFFGPVDEFSYVLGLFLSRATVFVAWLLLFLLVLIGYGLWSGVTYAWQNVLAAAAYAILPMCVLVALGPLIAAALRSMRGAVVGFLGAVIGLEAIQWAHGLLGQLAVGQRSFILAFAQDLLASLARAARWVSPFQYLARSLSAASFQEIVLLAGAALLYSILLFGVCVWMLRRRTVLP